MMATATTAPDIIPMMMFIFILGGVSSAGKETVVMVMPVLVDVPGGTMPVGGRPVVTVSRLDVPGKREPATESSARLEKRGLVTVVVFLMFDTCILGGRGVGGASISIEGGEISVLEGACAGNASGFGCVSSVNSVQSISVSGGFLMHILITNNLRSLPVILVCADSCAELGIVMTVDFVKTISLPGRVLVAMLVIGSEVGWPSIMMILVDVIVMIVTEDSVRTSVQISVVMENGLGIHAPSKSSNEGPSP